jgi:Ca2+-binding RTX toxin-like protein
VRGTAGADIMVGTAGNDILIGSRGNDRICGLGGKDTLRACEKIVRRGSPSGG